MNLNAPLPLANALLLINVPNAGLFPLTMAISKEYLMTTANSYPRH